MYMIIIKIDCFGCSQLLSDAMQFEHLDTLRCYAGKRVNQFNLNMHIPTLKVPTIRQVWYFIQQGDYAFSVALKNTYLHIHSVKHCHHF